MLGILPWIPVILVFLFFSFLNYTFHRDVKEIKVRSVWWVIGVSELFATEFSVCLYFVSVASFWPMRAIAIVLVLHVITHAIITLPRYRVIE
jgi:hypothetical protein